MTTDFFKTIKIDAGSNDFRSSFLRREEIASLETTQKSRFWSFCLTKSDVHFHEYNIPV
jgi:hypothetical protein